MDLLMIFFSAFLIALSGAMMPGPLLTAAIVLWMAFGMFRSLPSLSLALETGEGKRGNLVLTGILMSVLNPYWVIWWATVGLAYILHSRRFGLAGISFFFAGHILADFAWYSAVKGAVGRGERFL